MTLYFDSGALASETPTGAMHPATDEHGDRDGGQSPALPQGLSVAGDGKSSSPCAQKRRLHCQSKANAHF